LEEFHTAYPEGEAMFSARLSDDQEVNLTHGAEVELLCYGRRHEYARMLEETRLREAAPAIAALRRGFTSVIPPRALALLTWRDIERRVCGRPEIDIAALRRHTEYNGVSPHDPHILFFWRVLEDFSQADRAAFVRFVWAQGRLPATDAEWAGPPPLRFLIKRAVVDGVVTDMLPRADTCFLNAVIPPYPSLEIMRERLYTAISVDADGMDGDGVSPAVAAVHRLEETTRRTAISAPSGVELAVQAASDLLMRESSLHTASLHTRVEAMFGGTSVRDREEDPSHEGEWW
jgi:hypothetical protein